MSISESRIQRLNQLASNSSKHSNYQPVPEFMEDLVTVDRLNSLWRSPKPQLNLVENFHHVWKGGTVVELGANMGFTSLSLAFNHRDTTFIAVEANPTHAEFIHLAAETYALSNLRVISDSATPAGLAREFPSATLLDFNVAHHLGVDVSWPDLDSEARWWEILPQWFAPKGRFGAQFVQIGMNWGGNKSRPLHDLTDISGFAKAVIAKIPDGQDVAVFCISNGDRGLEYREFSPSVLTEKVERAFESGGLVGEYWKRPVFFLS